MQFKLRKTKSNVKLKKTFISPWHETDVGRVVICREQKILNRILPHFYGNYLINISDISLLGFLAKSPVKRKMLLINNLEEHGFRVDENIEVMQCDYNNLPLSPNSIDVAIIYHVLEFAENPYKILEEVSFALKDNGKMIIVCFNALSWLRIKQLFTIKKSKRHDISERNFYYAKFMYLPSLRKLLLHLNFSLEKIDNNLCKICNRKQSFLHKIKVFFSLSYNVSKIIIANKDAFCMMKLENNDAKLREQPLRYLKASTQANNIANNSNNN